jgi:hypothetical protein
MARIPTVAAPGQAVGTVRTGFTPQPFQRLSTSIEAFGGGAANTASQFEQSFADLGADIDAMNKEDDKVSSLKMQAEIDARTAEYQKQIKSVEGQERLDMLSGTHSSQMGGGYSLEQQYQQDLKNIRSNYQFATNTGGEVADIAITASQTKFTKDAFVQGLEARKLVQKQTVAAVIGAATLSATQAVTPEGAVAFASVDKALEKVATAVTDRAVGMAKQGGITDPKQIALLVQQQQELVIAKVFDEMVSKGNYLAASGLVDNYTKKGGALSGTPSAAVLQEKVLPFRNTIQGQKEFAAVLKAVNNDPVKLQERIYNETDPNKQKRLIAEHTKYNRVVAAQREEAIAGEVTKALGKIAQGLPVRLEELQTLSKYHPRTAFEFITGQTRAATRLAETQDQIEWREKWGGQPSAAMDRVLKTLRRTEPRQFIEIARSEGIKRFIGAEQHRALEGEIELAEQAIHNATKKSFNLPAQLKVIYGGNKTGAAKARQVFGRHGQTLIKIVNETRRKFAADGEEASTVDINKALAQRLIEIESAPPTIYPGGFRVSGGHDYAFIVDGGLPEDTAILEDTTRNARVLGTALGVDTKTVKAALTEPMTLKDLADKLNVETPKTIQEAAAKLDQLENLALQAGYSWDFVTYQLERGNAKINDVTVDRLLKNLKRTGAAAYKEWLAGQ